MIQPCTLASNSPKLIRFHELTEDEYFCTEDGAKQGVTFENTGTEPLVTLRYFGPEVNPDAPAMGAYRKAQAERARVQQELEQTVTQHFQEVRTAQEQMKVFEEGLLYQAKEAYDIAQFSFRHGVASLLEVIDAQRVYRQTLFEYAQARAEHSIALARLERAVGGMP